MILNRKALDTAAERNSGFARVHRAPLHPLPKSRTGRPTIARRFNAGKRANQTPPVPQGTAEVEDNSLIVPFYNQDTTAEWNFSFVREATRVPLRYAKRTSPSLELDAGVGKSNAL